MIQILNFKLFHVKLKNMKLKVNNDLTIMRIIYIFNLLTTFHLLKNKIIL